MSLAANLVEWQDGVLSIEWRVVLAISAGLILRWVITR